MVVIFQNGMYLKLDQDHHLKTFGGRASGPEPLVDLFNFTINTFKGQQVENLNL